MDFMRMRYYLSDLWEEARGGVIAGVVMLVIGFIAGLLFRKDVWIAFENCMMTGIPLWITILVGITAVAATLVVYKWRNRNPYRPSFLEETTIKIQGVSWSWNWVYNKQDKAYDLMNLKPLCPTCGKPLYHKDYAITETPYFCVEGHPSVGLDEDNNWVRRYLIDYLLDKYADEEQYMHVRNFFF